LTKNTPPYYRYKPEPVLESANMILYWDRSIITDKTVDFNRNDTVLIDRENKTALVIDTAVPLTHNLPKSETEKITKYEKLGPGNKKYPEAQQRTYMSSVISAEGVVIKNFVKHLEYIG
jgi:hypothetical protein